MTPPCEASEESNTLVYFIWGYMVIVIPLRFFSKWNLRICSVRLFICAFVRGQISETTQWITLILGMMKDLYAPSVPVIFVF